MSAQVTVGDLCLRAKTAIYLTAGAGMKWRYALRLVHQAGDAINTGMRIMRQFAPHTTYQTSETNTVPELLLFSRTLNCYQVMFVCVYAGTVGAT